VTLDHVASEDPAGTEHPREVRVEDLMPLGVGNFESWTPYCATRRVYQNIDLAELVDRNVGELLDGRGVRNIGRYSERVATASYDTLRYFFRQLFPTTGWDDVRASVGQTECDCSTDARRTADDDGRAVRQIESREWHDAVQLYSPGCKHDSSTRTSAKLVSRLKRT